MTGSPVPSVTEPRDSRVLVFSQRNVSRPVWQAMQYEFEDAVAALDDAVVIAPPATDAAYASALSRRIVNGSVHRLHGQRRTPPWVFPTMQPTRVTSDHDLFFAVFHYAHQLAHLRRLRNWRERSRRAVCWIIELYTPDVAPNADYLHLLEDFDEVYVTNPATAESLQALGLRRPVFLAPAVDAVAFSPVPRRPPRVLDCYNYGRAAAQPHRALLRLVEEQGLTYLYESRGDASVTDHREHRALLANMMKRSKFFFAHRINDSPERRERTGGDEALTTRYVEGTAGGAVLLGSPTRSAEFDSCFDWEDAIIPVAHDEADMAGVLNDLAAQPQRLAAARRANVRNSLLRHDWSHRWSVVLEAQGMSTTAAMQARAATLAHLAEDIDLAPEPVVLASRRAHPSSSLE